MTRLLHAFALAALILLAVLSFDARLAVVRADDKADCTKGSGDFQLRGCSRIIKSGRLYGKPSSRKKLTVTYYARGIAYSKKGQYDSSGRLYEKTIRKENLAVDYYARGIAYSNFGQ